MAATPPPPTPRPILRWLLLGCVGLCLVGGIATVATVLFARALGQYVLTENFEAVEADAERAATSP